MSETETHYGEVRREAGTNKVDTRPDLPCEEKTSLEKMERMTEDLCPPWTRTPPSPGVRDSESLLHDLISSAIPQSEASSPDLTVLTQGPNTETSCQDNDVPVLSNLLGLFPA